MYDLSTFKQIPKFNDYIVNRQGIVINKKLKKKLKVI